MTTEAKWLNYDGSIKETVKSRKKKYICEY